jgi:aryl-alcohol dehydrogenase-like predicted oxidoreductase
MEYRYIGETALKASALSLGCRELGKKVVTLDACRAVVKKALDLGINFFDTADIYGDGQSEEYLGVALARVPRDSYILATKGGSERLGPGTERQNGDPAFIRKSLEGSLKRLKTDYVDLYQLHNPDPAVPLEYTAEAFTRFIEQGKIRYAGVSNMDDQELAEWLRLVPRTASVQLSYSLLDRSRVEAVFPEGHALRVSLIPWAPLFTGFLSNPPPLEADKRSGYYGMLPMEFMESALKVSSLVREMAADYWTKPSVIALAFVVRRAEVATVPVGTTSPIHLQEDLRAMEVSLTPGDWAQLEKAAAAVPPPEILMTLEVMDVLSGGRVAVLPSGMKVRVPGTVRPKDKIEVNLWDGKVVSFPRQDQPV